LRGLNKSYGWGHHTGEKPPTFRDFYKKEKGVIPLRSKKSPEEYNKTIDYKNTG
jgi:hypothetical protein